LYLTSFKKLGLLTRLAEAAGRTPASVRNVAKRLSEGGRYDDSRQKD